MSYCLRSFSFVILLVLLLIATDPLYGQYAQVKRLSAETTDGVLIDTWVEKQAIRFGQDVIVHYKVENRSARAIYLVRENTPSATAENGTMSVGAPLPIPIHHGGYDYSFSEIGRGKSYRGQLIIPGSAYKVAGPWRVEVALGYVTDITGLNRRPNPNEDPAVLRGSLNSRMEVVWLAGLRVDTMKE